MSPVNPADPAEYLAVLATQLVAGTPIQTVAIQKGVSTETASWPALILNCPRVQRTRVALGGAAARRATFTIHGMYIDRWEQSARTLEQILADASATLATCAQNVEHTPTLGYTGVIAGDQIDITVDGATSDPGLGFPVVTGEIVITVIGALYYS